MIDLELVFNPFLFIEGILYLLTGYLVYDYDYSRKIVWILFFLIVVISPIADLFIARYGIIGMGTWVGNELELFIGHIFLGIFTISGYYIPIILEIFNK